MLEQAILQYRLQRAKSEQPPTGLAEADKLLCDLLSHTAEELFELRLCLNRKAWKQTPSLLTDQAVRALALEELADVLLMLDAFRHAAGWTLQDVQQAVLSKMDKNLTRLDHDCNRC